MVKYVLILCVLCGFPAWLSAQDDPGRVERRVIAAAEWKRAAQGLDYSQDVPPPPKAQRQPPVPNDNPVQHPFRNFDAQFWGNVAQILAILAAMAVVGYGIYRMLQEPRNKRIARDGAEITVDNLDTYLHETDLDRFLREALARQDYTQAIRIYFLQIIKQLSESEAINWSKEKTNRDYLLEMRPHPQYETFRGLTRTFERVWYGNIALSAAEFARLEPAYRAALQNAI
ncbi:MAG: DUF4129 domain-containing protein [Saprospirales bacterium]|nr:DUF4129 domain-containing protein [Saprospirales bacterium]